MPTQRFLVRFLGNSALPSDVYENVLYFDTAASDAEREATCDGIIDAYDSIGLGGITGAQVRVYDLAGGQPTYQKDYPTFVQNADTGPGEVAICLSYATVDDPESSTARRRGRIYIGPLQALFTGRPRPSEGLRDNVLGLGQALAQIGFATGTTWMMYSQRDNVAAKIESIWVDDAWDTQRRRGLAPTQRTVEDVQ